MIDKATRPWLMNESDERAAARGARMDESRAEHMINFVQKHLRLYEGEYAGKPIELMDWQLSLFYRLFGWVRFSEDWNREVRRFRKCSLWLPKKSGKSPTISCVGLYLLCGDAEPGNHVYSAAKDGKQAAIVHNHAIAMVQQSPALSQVCLVNRASKAITHEASRSTYAILSSEKQSAHGINAGGILIDETHVIDDLMAAILEWSTASRSEPIHFEASTAGMNPDGYGKRQYDYGKSVEDGTIDDDGFLYVNYSAPQDASDEDLGREELWRQANPSWGVTIKQSEFEQSYQRARRSVSEWNSFKAYRLNIWCDAEVIWLKGEDWDKCKADFTADDLAGLPCVIGLDLSRTRDMTSAVAVFRIEDEFYMLPYFWLPEETAKEYDHRAPMLQWAKSEQLDLTPGNVVDYAYIEERIAELNEQFVIQEVVYDRTYAEELTQRLEDQHGIPRTIFKQTMMHFAAPTAEFERLVMAGKLRHNGHEVMSWQAKHTQVRPDVNNNKRPIKPGPNDYRKIDGVVAAIMALARTIAEDAEPVLDFYEEHGVELA